MGIGKVLHMNVVADTSAVGSGEVRSMDLHMAPFAQRGLAGDLDQQGRILRRLPDAPPGVRAGDVEVAEDNVAHARRGRDIAQHPLRHQLRCAVRVDRVDGRALADKVFMRGPVYRRR